MQCVVQVADWTIYEPKNKWHFSVVKICWKPTRKQTVEFIETSEMIENAFQRFVDAADGHLQKSMDNDVQNWQKSQAYIAKENR